MTMSKKHYKDMAVRLGNLRFKYKDKSSSNTADLIMDYEDRINEFFNSFSDTYDGVLFYDAISKRVRDLVNQENEERIKKHEKALETLGVSNDKIQFGWNLHKSSE